MMGSVLTESLVEPAFERYRLSTMLGVAYSQRSERNDVEMVADDRPVGVARSGDGGKRR